MLDTKIEFKEPFLNNRFILRLNPELGIHDLQVNRISRPSWSIDSGWSLLEIECIELLDYPNSSKLVELASQQDSSEGLPLDFFIDMLDPAGAPVVALEVKGSLSSIDYSVLSYEDSSLSMFKITVKVLYLKHIFLKKK